MPDANYTREIPRLAAHDNVRLLGYVHTTYATRNISMVRKDIETYAAWPTASSNPDLAVRGIFFDETPQQYSANSLAYLQNLTDLTKGLNGFGSVPFVSYTTLLRFCIFFPYPIPLCIDSCTLYPLASRQTIGPVLAWLSGQRLFAFVVLFQGHSRHSFPPSAKLLLHSGSPSESLRLTTTRSYTTPARSQTRATSPLLTRQSFSKRLMAPSKYGMTRSCSRLYRTATEPSFVSLSTQSRIAWWGLNYAD